MSQYQPAHQLERALAADDHTPHTEWVGTSETIRGAEPVGIPDFALFAFLGVLVGLWLLAVNASWEDWE